MDLIRCKRWGNIAPLWKRYHRWLHWLSYLGFSESDIEKIEQEDEEELILIKDLEQNWKESQPCLSDKELIEIFPEAKTVIPVKIKEWKEEQVRLEEIVRNKIRLVKRRVKDDRSYWFWREWINFDEGEEWLRIKRAIEKLKKLDIISKRKQSVSKGWLTTTQIEQARAVPIEKVSDVQLKPVGKDLVGLCPLHEEKNPSFHVHPQANKFYCFGCQEKGDVITLICHLYGYSFLEAVKWLLKQ